MKDGDTRKETEVAVFSYLEHGFDELETPVETSQIHELTETILLLEEWASKINLTGHRGALEMAGRLVLDAAALNAELPELAAAKSFADLGTGAGFPGLPLAILNPQAQAYLVDSRLKRNHFQRAVRRALALERVHPVLGRSDEVESRACDLVIAQAMTNPKRALELMAQWSAPGGILVLPASETAKNPEVPPGYRPAELKTYIVPLVGTHRRLWIVRPSET